MPKNNLFIFIATAALTFSCIEFIETRAHTLPPLLLPALTDYLILFKQCRIATYFVLYKSYSTDTFHTFTAPLIKEQLPFMVYTTYEKNLPGKVFDQRESCILHLTISDYIGTIYASQLLQTIRELEDYNHHTRHLPVDLFYLDFIYCQNVTSQFDGNALAVFYPFGLFVWLGLTVSAIFISPFLAWKSRRSNIMPLLHFAAPLFSQGQAGGIKGFKFIFALWCFVGMFVNNHYTSLIESLLILRAKDPGVDDLSDLHEKGYRLVLPDNPTTGMTFVVLEKPVSRFGGNRYTDGLRENAEFIKAESAFSREYLQYLIKNEKKAMITDSMDIVSTKKALDTMLGSSESFGGVGCRKGEKRPTFALFFQSWPASNPNADALTKIMARCFGAGILDYFMAIYVKKRTHYFYSTITARLKGEGMNLTADGDGSINVQAPSRFSLENSQTVFMLYSWLVAMGALTLVALLEMAIQSEFFGRKCGPGLCAKSGGTRHALRPIE